MANESTKSIGFSMKNIQTPARSDADLVRAQKEINQMKLPDGRSRRRGGRSEQLALRTTQEIKKMVHDMAEAEGKGYIEIVEDAVRMRHNMMKGKL